MCEMILLAYRFDGRGGGEALLGDEIVSAMSEEALSWVHLNANHPATKSWLETNISDLQPSIIEALLAEETRPRMMHVNDGLLLILRGVNLNENEDPEDMISIRLWVEKNRVISLRKRRLKAVGDFEDYIKQSKAPKDAGEFICLLISRLFARIEPVLFELDASTDEVEECLLEEANATLRESIVVIRKKAIVFRRYMAPQRDAINQLRQTDADWLLDGHRQQLQEAYNNIVRYVEDLDALRERSQIVKDELANIIADKLNRHMYILSVISAIFLPLGFLTGLFGINVGGIPGADNSNAFLIFGGTLMMIVILQIIIFKLFKWF